jgi:ribosome maturation factor RimP
VARPTAARPARPARPRPEAPAADAAAVEAVLRAPLEAAGFELFDVDVVRAGQSSTLRVSIARAGGVDLEAVTTATRVVTPLLDELGLLDRLGLEVSSPGLERPLRTQAHLRGALGELVTVRTTVVIDGGRRHRGVLVEVTDDDLALAPDGAPEGSTCRIRHDQVASARTVFEWGPSTPAKGRPTPSPRPTEAPR